MKVLVACEFSGTVRRAFEALGHDAWSCDLLPAADGSAKHIQGDVLQILSHDWDLMIAHPPCTYLCSSGLHWNKRVPERQIQTDLAVDFVRALWAAPISKVAIENPVGCLSTKFMKPTQMIQPYQFGHSASKKTCLWLRNLPPLDATQYIEPRIVNGLPRWDNQTDSGQNRLTPSADRWALRSLTYEGIAAAMAKQWGTV